jgi:hypothetical protein
MKVFKPLRYAVHRFASYAIEREDRTVRAHSEAMRFIAEDAPAALRRVSPRERADSAEVPGRPADGERHDT